MFDPSSKLLRTSLLALAVGSLASCTKDEAGRPARLAAMSGSAAKGKVFYESSCAVCHHTDGLGDPTPGLDGGATYPSLVQRVKVLTPEAFMKATLEGVPGTFMLGYSMMSDQQLADGYAYIKTL